MNANPLDVIEADARWADDCRVSHEGVESCSAESEAARAAVAALVTYAREAVRRHPDLLGLENALSAFPEDPTP